MKATKVNDEITDITGFVSTPELNKFTKISFDAKI